MNTIHYSENGLNVDFIPDFIEKAHADRYFAELQCLPFYRPTYRIRGKDVKPKRMILAFGDENISYAYSGICVTANPWTPLLIELRDKMEKQTGCTYNYVLLNLYQDGTAYISQHKDNESSLDATFPISVLSFGAKRTLEFKKPDCASTLIDLEHGSFYSMMKPTNELFTHGIAPDPAIKDMRISLTFRHLIADPLKLKKPRLDMPPDEEVLRQTKPDPIVAEWTLEWGTYAQVSLENNLILRLHIRQFKETKNGVRYPTKNGIIMNCTTFDSFHKHLAKFHFFSVKDTFVVNNQLLMAFIDEDYCLLQQIFKADPYNFHFKPNGLRLSKDQFFKLCEVSSDIRACLIDTLLTKMIPAFILRKVETCTFSYIDYKEAKAHFITCFKQQLETTVYKVFSCYACTLGQLSQLNHECLNTDIREMFILNRESALLNFNIYDFVKRLTNNCICHYSPSFFEQFTSEFYRDFLENVFIHGK